MPVFKERSVKKLMQLKLTLASIAIIGALLQLGGGGESNR